MRLNLRLYNPASRRADDVVLTAEPDALVDDVVRALNTVQPGPLFVRGYPFCGHGRLSSSVLRDGDVVSVGRPGPGRGGAGLQLVAVAGPADGGRWVLRPGETIVGRESTADVSIDDPELSRRHLRLTLTPEGCAVEDLGSLNGTRVDGEALAGPTTVGPGAVIGAGRTTLEVRPAARASADLRPDGAGGLRFNRPARIRPAPREVRVALPCPPREREAHPFPWIQVMAPTVLSILLAAVLGRPELLLFSLVSPVLAVSTTISHRRRDAARGGEEQARYASELEEATARITKAVAEEQAAAREEFPDPLALAEVATVPTGRLWERRDHDPDAGVVRVGLAERPAAVVVTARGHDAAAEPPRLKAAPATVDLVAAGVLGVAGPEAQARAVARWLVAQLVVLRSPRDLRLVVLTDASAGADWDWVRWLPHARPDGAGAPTAAVGNDPGTLEQRAGELVAILDDRLATLREHGRARFSPTIVVVADGARQLRSLPGLTRILESGPSVGIVTIDLDTDVSRLAEEGTAQLALDPRRPTRAVLEVEGAEPVRDVAADQVDASWADEVARALAAVRDGSADDDRGSVPSSVRYLDLVDISLDGPEDVIERWSFASQRTEALVGVSADGPFHLDLRCDGPHALVAGTTGAGKSELLETLVVSLALANRPSAVNFVLVDHKGASAFAECADLPHTVGLVTNLDGHLTERALSSLDAELRRREQVLRDLGAPDVDAAWERRPREAAAASLARLVIVVDEFAELVHELPEFVTGLIRIARVGRSLGIHLVLATQRPAGMVSSEMRANTGLRVALRTEDEHDSTEVLEAPHAAGIPRSTPGRAFVRRRGREGIVEFQTARVAGPRRDLDGAAPAPSVHHVPWKLLGYPLPEGRSGEEAAGVETDLHALVTVIGDAAAVLRLPPPRRPWLDPLASSVVLDDDVAPAGRRGPTPIVFGVEDLPALQQQRPAVFDLARGGHLLIAGAARTGRSTALRSLAVAVARSMPPSDVHVYGLDFGNGALLALAELPHCGAVVVRSEADRVERLVARLSEEVARRQELLARGGFGDIGEQRRRTSAGQRLAYLVVLLDRWEGVATGFPPDTGSDVPTQLLRLVREGVGVGLRLVVAGDRSLLSDPIASLVSDVVVLRLDDRNDYRLASVDPTTVPREMPPGRALRAGSGLELQFGLLDPDPSSSAQAAAVRRVARRAEARWPPSRRRNRPFRVDALPASIDIAEAEALVHPDGAASPLWALVAVGGDELAAEGVDLARDRGVLVAGPPRSGRSTALMTIARSLCARGAGLVVVCPRPSPLEQLEGTPGVVATFSGVPGPEALSGALRRRRGPLAVIVDDAEGLVRTPADEVLSSFLRSTSDGHPVGVVVAGQLDDLKSDLGSTVAEARTAKAALLLSPGSTLDGEVAGLRLPRPMVGRMPPGRGVLAVAGRARVVQVPTCDPRAPVRAARRTRRTG